MKHLFVYGMSVFMATFCFFRNSNTGKLLLFAEALPKASNTGKRAVSSVSDGVRLNKVLTVKNLSRREGDKAVASGRVTVNNKQVEAGQKVVKGDIVRLDGKIVKGWENGIIASNASTKDKKKPSGGSKNAMKIKLPNPDIIFSNNHLVVVNKPAGYHCQPNESNEDARRNASSSSAKCLVTQLKLKRMGGGSDKSFLLPLHRIDQPCTGAVVLARNSKAGSRVAKAWRNGKVSKKYYCVVEGKLQDMMSRSISLEEGTYALEGILSKLVKSRSVQVSRVPPDFNVFEHVDSKKGRYCKLVWSLVQTCRRNRQGDLHLVEVSTHTGARHQVRAMLSYLANAPIAGDLRYGASAPLEDGSVALHAREIFMPSVVLGETDLSVPFVADIPKTWEHYFKLSERELVR